MNKPVYLIEYLFGKSISETKKSQFVGKELYIRQKMNFSLPLIMGFSQKKNWKKRLHLIQSISRLLIFVFLKN